MSETIETLAVPAAASVSACSAAVDRCMAAYKNAYRACATMGEADYKRLKAGNNAYRLAMPRTVSVTEIQAFIACIAHGINIGVFERHEPTQLLYAAQVALSAQRRKPGKK